jgi:hypothetical protein
MTTTTDVPAKKAGLNRIELTVGPEPGRVVRTDYFDPDDIVIDSNHRLERPGDDTRIQQLAESIRRDGQKQPIQVFIRAQKPYLVFGSRRCAACRLAKVSVRAEIVPELTPLDAVIARGVENLQREDVTPIEESIAVMQACDAVRAEAKGRGEVLSDEKVGEIVGGRLCKSPTWVRDRMFLSRLTGKARELVLEEKLPLLHAREIAKLADPVMRDKIAADAVSGGYTNNGDLVALPLLRHWVKANLSSLAVVSWRKDVAFAGAPACDACPSNTANADKMLFEHDKPSDRPGAVCLNPGCYENKRREAEKQLNRAVDSVTREASKASPASKAEILAEKTLKAAAPAVVRPETFVAAAQTAAKDARAAKSVKKATRSAPKPAKVDPQAEAKQKLESAEREWRRGIEKPLFKGIRAVPGRVSMLVMAKWENEICHAASNLGSDRRVSPGGVRELHRFASSLKSPTLKAIGAMESGADLAWDTFLDDASLATFELVAASIGVPLPPRPKLEDFLPKPDKGPWVFAPNEAERKLLHSKISPTWQETFKANVVKACGTDWICEAAVLSGRDGLSQLHVRHVTPVSGKAQRGQQRITFGGKSWLVGSQSQWPAKPKAVKAIAKKVGKAIKKSKRTK